MRHSSFRIMSYKAINCINQLGIQVIHLITVHIKKTAHTTQKHLVKSLNCFITSYCNNLSSYLSQYHTSHLIKLPRACIVCIGVSTPPQKHHALFLAKQPPLKSTNYPSPPPLPPPHHFRQSPPPYWFFVKPPPLKVGSLSEPLQY